MPRCHVASHSNPTSTHHLTSYRAYDMARQLVPTRRATTSDGCDTSHGRRSRIATETTTTNDDAWEVGDERRMPFRRHALLYLFLLYIENTPVDYPSRVSYPPNPRETRTRTR